MGLARLYTSTNTNGTKVYFVGDNEETIHGFIRTTGQEYGPLNFMGFVANLAIEAESITLDGWAQEVSD